MTQAVNLANFANNLDTSGGVNPSALNAAVPISKGGTGDVTAAGARTNLGLVIGTNVPSPTGTGASGTWPISISGNAATATTASNGGVTSVNGLTGAVTVTSNPGTVTSIATGNGLQGGTITSSGTLSLGSVAANTVGSYILAALPNISAYGNGTTFTYGSTLAGSNINIYYYIIRNTVCCGPAWTTPAANPGLSGTWRYMGSSSGVTALYVRIA
jgi:hypothetical protein